MCLEVRPALILTAQLCLGNGSKDGVNKPFTRPSISVGLWFFLTMIGSAEPMVLPAAPAAAAFDRPTLMGASNFSSPGGTKFWFPAISIPTGIRGHVAQHITLANDGGWGPAGPEGPCSTATHAQTYCQQIMLTSDGGRSYTTIRKATRGTSGNFNGYGDLGTWIPARRGVAAPPGHFQTIVGCNDCGTSFAHPTFLQTWVDDGAGNLTLSTNVSARFVDPPQAFNGSSAACRATHSECGLSTFSQSIIRTADGALLAAAYGHAAGQQLYSTAFFASADDGHSWSYRSRVDATAAMRASGPIKGPAEPTMATLADGRALAIFRVLSGASLWKAYSSDNGASWSQPVALSGSPGAVYAVWPQLLRLSNGVLALASGRPGLGFWLSADAAGERWVGHDVQAEHNRHVPSDPFETSSETTSYTGMAEAEPGVVLLSYDKIGARRVGDVQRVYSVRITVTP